MNAVLVALADRAIRQWGSRLVSPGGAVTTPADLTCVGFVKSQAILAILIATCMKLNLVPR